METRKVDEVTMPEHQCLAEHDRCRFCDEEATTWRGVAESRGALRGGRPRRGTGPRVTLSGTRLQPGRAPTDVLVDGRTGAHPVSERVQQRTFRAAAGLRMPCSPCS